MFFVVYLFFFSSRRRHTRCALVTGVQTCALPIFDRKSGEATIIEPPTPNQGARRVWSDSKGDLWISEWNSGQLSRFSPATKSWQSWKLPGEKPKAYAVYVDERDIVWVTDFGANATLTFDPKTEQWTSIPGSGPGANVRQILGRPGEVYLPESGTNRVML